MTSILLCVGIIVAMGAAVLGILTATSAERRSRALEERIAVLEAQWTGIAQRPAEGTGTKEAVFTEAAPKAIGPYSQAVATPWLLYTSGQLGIDPATSKLVDGVENQANQAMKNLGAILQAKGLTYGNIVKTTIYLKDLTDFTVVNNVYASYFSGDDPARSTVQVAALPLGGLVEIECVAIR